MSAWIPFMLFSFIMAATPGPTNILVFSVSSRHGWTAALPLVLGATAGTAALLLGAGVGLGEVLLRLPPLRIALLWTGVAWLSWLAWKIFSSPPAAVASGNPGKQEKLRLGFRGMVGLQLINPKSWIMALSAVTVFSNSTHEGIAHSVAMASVFFLIALPSVGSWAALSMSTGRLIRSPRHVIYLNRGLALLLLASAWIAAFM